MAGSVVAGWSVIAVSVSDMVDIATRPVSDGLLLLQRLEIGLPGGQFGFDGDDVGDVRRLPEQRPHPGHAGRHAVDPARHVHQFGRDVLTGLGAVRQLTQRGDLVDHGVVLIGRYPQADRHLRSAAVGAGLKPAGRRRDPPDTGRGGRDRRGPGGAVRRRVRGRVVGGRDGCDHQPNGQVRGLDHLAAVDRHGGQLLRAGRLRRPRRVAVGGPGRGRRRAELVGSRLCRRELIRCGPGLQPRSPLCRCCSTNPTYSPRA